MTARDDLRAAIAREQARIARLDREREDAQARVRSLEIELGAPAGDAASLAPPAPRAATEKVTLFRSLFRGRDDIFPKLWINPRTSRKGYAPACANEWVRGVCEKPRIKCSECPNQAFIPVSHDVEIGRASCRERVYLRV